MGRSFIAPEVFNCQAPDTGNMEILELYGTPLQKDMWLKKLLNGEIRSCFGMTEPGVASSDATNIETTITREGKYYHITGKKWFTSGAGDPHCKVCIVMGVTNGSTDNHNKHSMVIVPMDTPGVKKIRPLTVFGYDHAPHGHWEVHFENVKVPVENVLLGEGRGFEIAQSRLRPGRIHHCMRSIGLAERCQELMIKRALSRKTFGKEIARHGAVQDFIARSRLEIEQARLLTLRAAYCMDRVGNKKARDLIAMIKIVAPNVLCNVIDRAIQVHGAAGVSQDTILP
jgi:acyl-CoA dehydrogenase